MWIWSLRGAEGVRHSVRFQLIIISSYFLLYFSRSIILDILIFVLAIWAYIHTAKSMITHRDEITFKPKSKASLYVFPETRDRANLLSFFYWLGLILLLFSLILLFGNVDLDKDHIISQSLTLLFFYYFGSVGLIGLINIELQKRENILTPSLSEWNEIQKVTKVGGLRVFIWCLRGSTGTRLLVWYHLIILVSGSLLYLSKNTALDILILGLSIFIYICSLKYMIGKKSEIEFSSDHAMYTAFPATKAGAGNVSFFAWLIGLMPFAISLTFLLGNVASSLWLGIIVGILYYMGNLGFIQILNVKLQKYET